MWLHRLLQCVLCRALYMLWQNVSLSLRPSVCYTRAMNALVQSSSRSAPIPDIFYFQNTLKSHLFISFPSVWLYHWLFLHRVLEAACAAYASLNLSLLHYITVSTRVNMSPNCFVYYFCHSCYLTRNITVKFSLIEIHTNSPWAWMSVQGHSGGVKKTRRTVNTKCSKATWFGQLLVYSFYA